MRNERRRAKHASHNVTRPTRELGWKRHETVSTKAYDHFIASMDAFDAAQRIREAINPVFFDAFNEQLQRLDERL